MSKICLSANNSALTRCTVRRQQSSLVPSFRTYSGFSNEKMRQEEVLKLRESLQRDKVQFVDKPFYAAGYDSPFKLTNRRNEIWILKEEQK